MAIVEGSDAAWLHCMNNDMETKSDKKLHIALPVAYSDEKCQKQLYQLFKEASEEGLIQGFKIINRGDSWNMQEELGGDDVTIDENPSARLYNNPVTIYLRKDVETSLLADLCQELETLLKGKPGLDARLLSSVDIPLSPHISFRQEELKNQYVAVAYATEEELQQLKEQAEGSKEYKDLVKALARKEQSQRDEDPKENFVQRIHAKYYRQLSKGLSSTEISEQFHAACLLLGLDDKDFLGKTSEQERLALISQAHDKVSLQIHPDGFQLCQLETTKTKASELFQLLKTAKDTVDLIAKNPTILEKNALPVQEPYSPEYQYELRDGFKSNPRDYLDMVVTNQRIFLYQNWEDVGSLSNERKVINVSGAEAFFHLFLAGALPDRFAKDHFEVLVKKLFQVKDGILKNSQRWFLEKALTTPKLVALFYKSDLEKAAILASQQGIVAIGNNPTDVFLYFYNKMPETPLSQCIRMLEEEDDFDKEKVIQYILNNPENLEKLPKETLEVFFEADNRLKKYIQSNPRLFRHLSAYYLTTALWSPLSKKAIEEKDIDEIDAFVIRNLLLNNFACLSLLSQERLLKLQNFISKNSAELPAFLSKEIQESAVRSFSNDANLTDSQNYIKRLFLSSDGSNIANALNEEALLWLAKEAELQWPDYYPIVVALLNLGAENSAMPYLNKIADELSLPRATDKYAWLKLLGDNKDKLHERLLTLRKEKITFLLKRYREFLETGEEQLADSKDQLDSFGAREDKQQMYKDFRSELKQQFKSLEDQLKVGKRLEEIKAKTQQYKKITERADINEGQLYDEWAFDDLASKTMRKILGEGYDDDVMLFDIKGELSVIDALEKLFLVYDALGKGKGFYNDLCFRTCQNSAFNGLSTFDPDIIKAHLISYAQNEFAVFIALKRINIGYKVRTDDIAIKELARIATLYEKLDIADQLVSHLPKVYEILAEREVCLRKELGGETISQEFLLPYIEMRVRYPHVAHHPQLENFAILYVLNNFCQSIGSVFEDGMRDQNMRVLFGKIKTCLSSHALEKPELDAMVEKSLVALAEFLQCSIAVSEHANVMKGLSQCKFFGVCLGLATLNDDELASVQIASAVVSAISEKSLPAEVEASSAAVKQLMQCINSATPISFTKVVEVLQEGRLKKRLLENDADSLQIN